MLRIISLKRVFDISIAACTLVFLSPLFLILLSLIGYCLGRPVFFRQQRTGLHGKPFTILKFRTMLDTKDERGIDLPDEERLTKLGLFLRSSSLDELPELWNVLKGEMSLVGPRPLLTEYLPLYSDEQMQRHEVLPGISGWAQVNGRNALSFEQKFKMDNWYVTNQSFMLDLKILFLTIKQVLSRQGVTENEHVSCKKFSGPSS